MHKRMSRAIIALLALAIIASVLSPIVLAEDTVELFQNDNVIIDIDIYDPHDIDEFAESSEIGEVILNEAGVEPLNLDSVLTRGRAATYIVMGREPILTTNGNIPNMPFTDVPISDWTRNMIAWAWRNGWVTGRAPTTFVPNAAITREEFTALIVRAFNVPSSNITPPFSDWNNVSVWARPYVRSAHARGLILGFPDGTFRPRNNITRRDGITITQRASGRTITDPVPRTITWNANGGTGGTSWSRIPNHAIGPLPTATRATYSRNNRWFNTTNITGGTLITPNTRMPSGNVTYTVRWHNLTSNTRHINNWFHAAAVPLNPLAAPNATWSRAMTEGMHQWNSSVAPVLFVFGGSGNNQVQARSFAWPELGWYRPREWTGNGTAGFRITRFDIELNTRTITAYVNARPTTHSLSNVVQSIMVHELGHVVGLGDNPGVAAPNSIMNHSRNRNDVRTPQAFDVRSVNLLY